MPKTTQAKVLNQLQALITNSLHELASLERGEYSGLGGVDRQDEEIKRIRERIKKLMAIRYDLECVMSGVDSITLIPAGLRS